LGLDVHSDLDAETRRDGYVEDFAVGAIGIADETSVDAG
jgi:hypothetical protein